MTALDESSPAAVDEPTAPSVSPGVAAYASQAQQLFKAGKSRQALGQLFIELVLYFLATFQLD